MKINKDTYEALPAAMKAAFKAVDGNADEYHNGEEDAGALKTALEKEREEKKAAAIARDDYKAKADAAEAAQKAKEDAAARKSGDFTKIEEDYKKRLADLEAANAKVQADAQAAVAALAEESVIKDIASVFVAPGAMSAFIKNRLRTEVVDGKAVTRVLDAKGEATSMSPAELKKEFLDNSELKGILVASKGNGGGATGPKEGGGSTSGKIDAATADPKDLVAYLEAKGIGGESD